MDTQEHNRRIKALKNAIAQTSMAGDCCITSDHPGYVGIRTSHLSWPRMLTINQHCELIGAWASGEAIETQWKWRDGGAR